MDTGQWLVIGLCAFLFVWYAGGWYYNRRRGHAILNWLRTGLEVFGKPGETRWLSPLHSSAQVILTEARSPFRKLGVVFVLEPRENLPVWAFRHALGRRDELYLRADLRSAPAQEIEVGRKGRAELAALVKPTKEDAYSPLPGTDHFDLARRGKTDDQVVERLKEFLTRYETVILRMSLQRQSPHLILRARLAPLMNKPIGEIFAALQASLK
jgi:hypothetical protein